ncbi:MAG: hypothetical protein DCC71_21135 [Proteobacteria bacterium]|nr:MAG: hypothetical protein DCC71_21135 [Pseudomonadota bacterium]
MTHRIVRIWFFSIAALLLLLPAAASAQFGAKQEVYEVPPGMVGRHNGECKRITRQIQRYAEVADMAKERGDERWEEGTLNHIARLSERRAQLCPTLYAQKPIGQELAKILKGAAKIAMKLFTMGLI